MKGSLPPEARFCDIQLPARLKKVLRNLNCETVADARKMGPSSFVGIPNFGGASLSKLLILLFGEEEAERQLHNIQIRKKIQHLISRRSVYKWHTSRTPKTLDQLRRYDNKLAKMHETIGKTWVPPEVEDQK
jgi:hypothetical protein